MNKSECLLVWHGSKRALAPAIVKMFPAGYEKMLYVEPFCGAAAAGRLKVGGNYYNASTHNPANGTWTLRTDTWTTNPDTSAAWTADQVNGSGGNALQAFGFFSNDASPTVRFSSVIVRVTYTPPAQGGPKRVYVSQAGVPAGGEPEIPWRKRL